MTDKDGSKSKKQVHFKDTETQEAIENRKEIRQLLKLWVEVKKRLDKVHEKDEKARLRNVKVFEWAEDQMTRYRMEVRQQSERNKERQE
jgi:hypothetical protein